MCHSQPRLQPNKNDATDDNCGNHSFEDDNHILRVIIFILVL